MEKSLLNENGEIDSLLNDAKETVDRKRKRGEDDRTNDDKPYDDKPCNNRTPDNYSRRYMCLFSITRGNCIRRNCKDAHSYSEINPLTCNYGKKCMIDNCMYIHPKEDVRGYCKRTKQIINREKIPYKRYYQFQKEKKRWDNSRGYPNYTPSRTREEYNYPQYNNGNYDEYYPSYNNPYNNGTYDEYGLYEK